MAHMKIAMIGQKGIPAQAGGIERHVEELSVELAKRGHDVLVFCRTWYVWPVADLHGVRCIATPSIHTKHLDTITHTFTSILRAVWEDVDVFHIHGVGPALLSWLPRLLKPSARVVVTFHCIDGSYRQWGWLARSMLRLGEWFAVTIPHATITVSKGLQAYIRARFEKDVAHITNGTRLAQNAGDTERLKNLGLLPNKYLMMCGRLIRLKGAHTLIRAWQLLRSTRPDLTAGYALAIVGSGSATDSYTEEIRTLTKDDPTVVLTGTRTGEDLHALFAGSYAVVHPSSSEGLSMTILEAMGHGKCVLSSEIPGNLELTQEHGMTFRTDDIKDLSDKLAMLLEHPDLIQAVGLEAHGYVTRSHAWEDIGEQTACLYEAIDFVPNLKPQAHKA